MMVVILTLIWFLPVHRSSQLLLTAPRRLSGPSEKEGGCFSRSDGDGDDDDDGDGDDDDDDD